MPGQHNVLNTLAALAIADELEVPLDVIKEALRTFDGVARRFSVVKEVNGVTLVDDYGHHPAEIEATLKAARSAYSERVLVAFQPHRYSRTSHLFDDFTRAFNEADVLFVTDIYPAGEAPIPGITGERLARGIAEHGHHAVRHVSDRTLLSAELASAARPGDVVIALGAGDINKILPLVANEITARAAAAKEPEA
jgi:UDP-N-acetylmuramate--alanine ligase